MQISSKKAFSVQYDSVNYKWVINVELPFGFVLITSIDAVEWPLRELQFDLSYEELTGKNVQSAKYRGQPGYDEYQQFLDEVDYIDALMRSFGDYFSVSLSFKAKVQSDNSSKIGFTVLSFSDTKLQISSNAISDRPIEIIKTTTPSSFSSIDLFSVQMPEYLKVLDSNGFDVFR